MKNLKSLALLSVLAIALFVNYAGPQLIENNNITLVALASGPTSVGGEYSTWDRIASGTQTSSVYAQQSTTVEVSAISYNTSTNTWSLGGGSYQSNSGELKGFLTDCSASGVYCGQSQPMWSPI